MLFQIKPFEFVQDLSVNVSTPMYWEYYHFLMGQFSLHLLNESSKVQSLKIPNHCPIYFLSPIKIVLLTLSVCNLFNRT